jgi:hypothetical protein
MCASAGQDALSNPTCAPQTDPLDLVRIDFEVGLHDNDLGVVRSLYLRARAATFRS